VASQQFSKSITGQLDLTNDANFAARGGEGRGERERRGEGGDGETDFLFAIFYLPFDICHLIFAI